MQIGMPIHLEPLTGVRRSHLRRQMYRCANALVRAAATNVGHRGVNVGVGRVRLVSCHVKNDGISRSHRRAPLRAKCSSCRGMCKLCNDAVRNEGK